MEKENIEDIIIFRKAVKISKSELKAQKILQPELNIDLEKDHYEKTIKFNHNKFRNYLKKKLENKNNTKKKIAALDEIEGLLSKGIEEHLNCCPLKKRCDVEEIFYEAFSYIDYKKNELFATKSFYEKLVAQPVSIAILFVGVVNIVIALFKIFNIIS